MTIYVGGVPIDLDPSLLERWGIGIAFMDAISRSLRETDWSALSRWADDGGAL